MYNDLLHEYMKNSRRREGRQNVFFKLNDHAVLINQYHFIEKDDKISSTKYVQKAKKIYFPCKIFKQIINFQGRNEY